MNLKEFKDQVDWLYNNQMRSVHQLPESITVGIVVKTAGTVGGTPIVSIKNIHAGFDWDNGTLLVYPEKDLRVIEADELLALRKASEKDGWAQYENVGLKSDIKKLNAKIALLEQNGN
jgi:hypothetical protein